jgi:hypothetical protein
MCGVASEASYGFPLLNVCVPDDKLPAAIRFLAIDLLLIWSPTDARRAIGREIVRSPAFFRRHLFSTNE